MSPTTPCRRRSDARLASRPRRKRPIFLPSGIFAFSMAGLVLLSAQACTEAEARAPLANGQASEKVLVQSVLDAVAVRDTAALRGFLVSRREYEGVLWPEMPDEEYTPFDFVWSLNETNSRKGLRQLLGTYGGLPLEVVSIELGKDPEVYDSFTLYPGTKVTVRRTDTGQEGILPTFDVLVKYGRVWKLMNFDEL